MAEHGGLRAIMVLDRRDAHRTVLGDQGSAPGGDRRPLSGVREGPRTRPFASLLHVERVANGTRTRDHRDHNPGLYQLSYRHREAGTSVAR